ncbi:Eco57I restriction-modification methylase domain-containing protein [Bergeyella zoohelcum]|uniref:Eco57I restriction-modification methylase domain-containing protein n=1 Tax=Bergeyella zoohelcum TaxID=1015 RepID=UPI002A916278|nr:Eco57I restriction-modification methylase domain-containing protein [Bergeyella zoohelcum]MDY6026176.1 Eco57I restriction-modification methylase domain-containing protein [Bergeyella zoohelcum]
MKTIIENFSVETIKNYFFDEINDFSPSSEDFSDILKENENFSKLEKLGESTLSQSKDILFFACKSEAKLSERSAKKVQYEITKRLMTEERKDSAIAIFYDDNGDFRFSFVRRNYGSDEKFSSWKRYTYFVSKNQPNRTFLDRISNADFSSLEKIQEAFSVEKLTKDFYNDLYKWYQWTLTDSVGITFPNDTRTSDDDKEKLEEKIIRLITRVLFVWFIKHKHLVPNELFQPEKLEKILKDFDKNSSESGNYYNAILQNLFFATLNKPVKERGFATLKSSRDIKTLYRYAELFSISEDEILQIFEKIPFLNGGLFECLDKELKTDGVQYHLDGFSRNDKKSANGNFSHRAFIPNCVFFGNAENEGLIPLLERYNFTIEENSTSETQVALDPELLGNVFENLLGAFNDETKETARKQSGSFYTPREVVDFMVDESLKAYLQPKNENETEFLEILFAENNSETQENGLNNKNLCEKFSEKLKKVKILDPACGSGAFPMGILNRMVELLDKLDIENQKTHHELKLELIKNCIFGVDIQSIAVQISKLRFFISLIVEQEELDFEKENYGIHTLPNLETKFVAANSLISLQTENDYFYSKTKDNRLNQLKDELLSVRNQHFEAKNVNQKKTLRQRDEELRSEIVTYLSKIATQPNQEKIQRNLLEIEKKQKERKNYETENWVDTEEPTQMDLFGNETPKNLFQVDLNEKERKKIDKIIKALQKEIDEENKKTQKVGFENQLNQIAQWNPYDQNATSEFFDMEWMFGVEDGFDIVIGNPPYISTKGISAELKKDLEMQFGFADDTYNHFFFKGFDLLNSGGVLSFITPKTFWTTQTKRNLRDLILSQQINYIFDTANPFESAMVDTCITSFSKIKNQNIEIKFLDGSKNLKKPIVYYTNQQIFIDTQNSVIFKPTEYNLKIHSLYGKKVKELYEKWWDKISTSKNIAKNEKELQAYRDNLKAGDIALLGCLTEGGQGLATANNGKYIAVRKSTKWADNILKSRPKKLAEAVTKKKIKDERLPQDGDYTTYLNGLSEKEIAELFDDLKEKYGRDIFGQGYIYKLIEDSEIADVEALTQDEKDNGIDTNKNYYVPYDKGDKDGNRWYLETPFAIAWNKENVGFLKTNSGKKGEGMPVVRNPQFYFKEGFCYSDINTTFLKCRVKLKTINDVKSMSLYSLSKNIPAFYIVCLINSSFISWYVDDFVNNTQTFQINDARQLPIIIPSKEELQKFENLFNSAIDIKKKQLSNSISEKEAETQLSEIQGKLDIMVNTLYAV